MSKLNKYDFSGWATKNNLKCTDGRTIMKDAFQHNDGQTVPLVWNHQHNSADNVLGHALLENRDEGVYAYCSFNQTEAGQSAHELVKHGDVTAMSIFAGSLKQQGPHVLHGSIREVSLVLSGANPGALIDSVMLHSDNGDVPSPDEVIIYTDEAIMLQHAEEENKEETLKHEDKKEKKEEEETLKDVWDTLSEKQKKAVDAVVGGIIKEQDKKDEKKDVKHSTDDEGEENIMKHNVFDKETKQTQTEVQTLTHSEFKAVMDDAVRFGSLAHSFLQHGITDIEYMFPDAQKMPSGAPTFIKRRMEWVENFMSNVGKTPFSRIKSLFADITADEARARGYVKGNEKINEVFAMLKRTTDPTTVYKKQKLERDDIIDITDFDVISWLKSEMRMMLEEEMARAALISDGRLAGTEGKISESNIRPIWTDADLFAVKVLFEIAADATEDEVSKLFIRNCIKSRKNYKGSGSPTLYTTEDRLTDCLLMEDSLGRVIYETKDKLASALRVKDIVTVPVMEGATRDVSGATHTLEGIVVNLRDYNIGADKGGAVNMFDDFDIDFNAYKYLIETRCSGALTMPHSALVIESKPQELL